MVDNPDRRPTSSSRRNFLKIGAGVLAGAAVVSVTDVPLVGAKQTNADSLQARLSSTESRLDSATSQLSSANGRVTTLTTKLEAAQTQVSSLQISLDLITGFLTLGVNEQSLVEAMVETIIPSDSNGPGAKEAGVIYFIDRQLGSDYGKSAWMYMRGPFVPAGISGPVTLDGITYSAGTPNPRQGAGGKYQYDMDMRTFWRTGLAAAEAYANAAYGGNFETLSSAQQLQCLQDLWNNKPTSFGSITPSDFAFELTFMAWSGFTMDPIYGGNLNMVGWKYLAFNGTNTGNFYGEGLTPQELMVASTPTRLQPASLAQFQKGSP